MLISEAPIHSYTATWMPPKGFSTTQIDMHVAEDIGLYKFDVLQSAWVGTYQGNRPAGEREQEYQHPDR